MSIKVPILCPIEQIQPSNYNIMAQLYLTVSPLENTPLNGYLNFLPNAGNLGLQLSYYFLDLVNNYQI